jgi:hypothetical protein
MATDKMDLHAEAKTTAKDIQPSVALAQSTAFPTQFKFKLSKDGTYLGWLAMNGNEWCFLGAETQAAIMTALTYKSTDWVILKSAIDYNNDWYLAHDRNGSWNEQRPVGFFWWNRAQDIPWKLDGKRLYSQGGQGKPTHPLAYYSGYQWLYTAETAGYTAVDVEVVTIVK